MAYVIRALARDGRFRAFAVECRDVVETVRKLQGLSPVASAALGRTLAGVAMLSADLKVGKVLIQINGRGPLGELIAEGDHQGNIRGTVQHPDVHIPIKEKKLPVGKAVGKNGYISVIKDLGLKEVYQSSTQLVSGEIAEDLAYYLTVSEQIPSAVALGVLVNTDGSIISAGGYLIQKMPDATEEEVKELEEKLKNFLPVTALLSQGKTPEEILKMLFPDVKVLEKREIHYKCTCSMERVENSLIALGKEELESLLNEGKPVEVICHFCKTKYTVLPERIKELIKEIEKRRENHDI